MFWKYVKVICLLILFTSIVATEVSAREIKLMINGQEKTIWSAPHQPYLTVSSLEELEQHYQEIRTVLPSMPFIMEGKWVVPDTQRTFRTFNDNPEYEEYFSPNGDYVAVIEPAEGPSGSSRYSKRIKLMTIDGRVLWEKEEGPIGALVTNEGRVIGRSQYNEPLSLTFYERDGTVISHTKDIFTKGLNMPRTGHLRLVPHEKILLAWELRQVVALDYEGKTLWKYTAPNDPVIAFIGSPGLDPLGRGIYIPVWYKDNSSVFMLDPQTGVSKSILWEHKPIPIPVQHFSSSGEKAAVVTQDQIGLLDWRGGELMFINRSRDGLIDLLEGKAVVVTRADASSVSDEPARLVVPLSNGLGTSIFNEIGERIWRLDLRAEYTKNYLSSDAKMLGVVVTNSVMNEPPTIYGILVYRVEVS